MESKLREGLGVEIEIDDLIHAEPISHLFKTLDVLDYFLRMGGNVSLAEFEYDTGSQIFVALEKLAEHADAYPRLRLVPFAVERVEGAVGADGQLLKPDAHGRPRGVDDGDADGDRPEEPW